LCDGHDGAIRATTQDPRSTHKLASDLQENQVNSQTRKHDDACHTHSIQTIPGDTSCYIEVRLKRILYVLERDNFTNQESGKTYLDTEPIPLPSILVSRRVKLE
jgi:hypothetical protein